MTTVFVLLVIFQIKHLVCDYFLQGEYMLGKFRPDWSFVLPLMAHCFVHFIATVIICTFFAGPIFSFILAFVDFTSHLYIDRIKASPKLLGRFKPNQKQFWWALGGDQMLHHFVHYFIIFCLIFK